MNFPTLFKKNSTDGLQFWTIGVEIQPQVETGVDYGVIVTTFGQEGTTSPQVTRDVIKEGKNLGKKNAKNPVDQAIAEVQAKFEKMKKKGYVENRDRALLGENELEGVSPMLAHKFSEHAEKIAFPAFTQPKFDGIRCLVRSDYSLWSRSQKPIISVPHIVEAIKQVFGGEAPPFDGELYNHAFKDNFEHIVSLVRQQKKPDPKHTDVQYYIYDLVMPDLEFHERALLLTEMEKRVKEILGPDSPLRFAWTEEVQDVDHLMDMFQKFREMGFEGAMARNRGGVYEQKRSYHLQKVKEFDDAEYKIVGVVEGRGKLQGHAGSFICVTAEGTQFEVKLKGELSKLKEYFENQALFMNKILTVQYQGLTTKNKVPRFPVGLRIREAE